MRTTPAAPRCVAPDVGGDRRRRAVALLVVVTGTLAWSCSAVDEPRDRAWLSVEVLPNGDAVVSLAAPPGDGTAARTVQGAATELFPEGSAGDPSRLGGSAEPRISVAVTGAIVPGVSPEFVVDTAALGQPASSTLGAVEVCLPPMDVLVDAGRGRAGPTFTDGCYVLLRGQIVTFTLQPEGWRLPASMLGAIAALAIAGLAWRSRPRRAPWVAVAALVVVALTVLMASDAATAALMAGAGGPVVPAWLVSRLLLAAAAVLAVVAWARASRGREVVPADP